MVTMFAKLADKTCMNIITMIITIIIIIITSIVWKDGRAKGCHGVKKRREMKMRS